MKFCIMSATWLALTLILIAATIFMDVGNNIYLHIWIIYLLGQNSIDRVEFLTALSDLRCEMLTAGKEDFKD